MTSFWWSNLFGFLLRVNASDEWSYWASNLRSKLLLQLNLSLIDTEFPLHIRHWLFLLERLVMICNQWLLIDLINYQLSSSLSPCNPCYQLLKPAVLFNISFLYFLDPSHLIVHQRIVNHHTLSLPRLLAQIWKSIDLWPTACQSRDAYSLAGDAWLIFIDIVPDFNQGISIRIL
jgi:hypothetical protein